jgi:hypothetical protein
MGIKHIEIKPMTWVSPEFSVASKCDLDIFAGNGETLIVASDREDNRDIGLPVSEGPGIIAQTLHRWYGYEPESMIWIECDTDAGTCERVDLACSDHRVMDWKRFPCAPEEVETIRARFQP